MKVVRRAPTSPTHVGSVMKSPAVAVAPTETLEGVVREMRAAGVSAVVVVEATGLAGILTERDVMRAVGDGRDPSATQAEAYMTPRPETVGFDDLASHAASQMVSLGVRHLPVVEKGEVVGVISARDLLRLGDSNRRLAELSSEPW